MRPGELGGLPTCDDEECCSWNGFEVFGILGMSLILKSFFFGGLQGRSLGGVETNDAFSVANVSAWSAQNCSICLCCSETLSTIVNALPIHQWRGLVLIRLAAGNGPGL
jgi:hypothetical protein